MIPQSASPESGLRTDEPVVLYQGGLHHGAVVHQLLLGALLGTEHTLEKIVILLEMHQHQKHHQQDHPTLSPLPSQAFSQLIPKPIQSES